MTRSGGGLFDSLRALLATGLGIAQLRLALFGTELEAEKLRLFGALWRLALGLLLLGVGAVLLAAFVLLLFWDSHRLAALGMLVLASVGGGVGLLWAARAALHAEGSGPFALSLGELQRDLDGLQAAASPAEKPATAAVTTAATTATQR